MTIKRPSGTLRHKEPARGRVRARIGFPQSIRGNLILILCILLIPALIIQIYTYHEKFESQRAEKLQGNLEIARAVGKTFETFVQNLFSDELVIGLACSPSKPTSTTNQNEILLEARKAHPAIWQLSWADPSGVVSASTDPELIGRDLHDRYSFLELISGQDWVLSSLLLSESGRSHLYPLMNCTLGHADVFSYLFNEQPLNYQVNSLPALELLPCFRALHLFLNLLLLKMVPDSCLSHLRSPSLMSILGGEYIPIL